MLSVLRLAAVSVALVGTFACIAAEPTMKRSPEVTPSSEKRASDAAPGVTDERHRTEQAETLSKSESEAQEKRVADATWALFWATLVLAVVTAGLFGATYVLSRDARNSARRQADETRESLKIAKASADASVRNVETLERANAPYVFPQIANVRIVADSAASAAKTPARVDVAFMNHGKTTALVRMVRWKLCLAHELPPVADYTTSDMSPMPGVLTGERASSSGFICTAATLDAHEWAGLSRKLKDPAARRFFFFGFVQYDDVFGYTHKTGFVFKIFKNGTYRIKNYAGYAYHVKEPTKPTSVSDRADEEVVQTD